MKYIKLTTFFVVAYFLFTGCKTVQTSEVKVQPLNFTDKIVSEKWLFWTSYYQNGNVLSVNDIKYITQNVPQCKFLLEKSNKKMLVSYAFDALSLVSLIASFDDRLLLYSLSSFVIFETGSILTFTQSVSLINEAVELYNKSLETNSP